MQKQIARDNHYVPKWYQKGFFIKGRHKLHVRNLHPATKTLPNGKNQSELEIEELGPKLAFNKFDLYTTHFGETLNDDIETFLFGQIDKTGADAVRAWIAGDPVQMHRRFKDFFTYMDAQKLRTPKGLDWIIKHYHGLPQMELMRQMQALRLMHCTMWSECVREIVSAANSPIKFLVSDHPVTIFHPKIGPDTEECEYPGDPSVQLMSTQTIFALDANHCLILTNLEYAENPEEVNHMARRTNARFRGDSMARTDAMVRGRELTEAEVNAINFVILSRAKKYVAAGRPEWLYPERECHLSWVDIAKILLPRDGLLNFGGDIYIGFEDGTSAYRDKFGRTSKAHELHAKPPLKNDPEPSAPCGCGSGLIFRDCCADIAPQRRPSWRVRGIRERNLALIRGISRILELDGSAASWLHVRRTLSEEQVRRINELYAALWPIGTQLIDLLPSPQTRRSRALYMGMTDPRKLSKCVTGMLACIDELVIVHPFINANGIRNKFSPIHQPASHRAQTLRNVFTLLVLEPGIQAGRIHLVPDPMDHDPGFRDEIMTIADRIPDNFKLGQIDEELARELAHDEKMRLIKRLPPDDMKTYIRGRLPADSEELTDSVIDLIVKMWKEDIDSDPLALLTPVIPVSEGSEFMTVKGFARETGLYIATLTGAFVYTDSDTQWARLHETDGVNSYEQDPGAETIIARIGTVQIKVPPISNQSDSESKIIDADRAFIREATVALRMGIPPVVKFGLAESAAPSPPVGETLRSFALRASVPVCGFQRTDVSRLVMTFGRLDDVAPVRLAIFLEPHTEQSEKSADM